MKRLTLSYGVEPGPRRTLSLPLGRANLMLGLLAATTAWSVVTVGSMAAGVLHWGDAPAVSDAHVTVRSASVAGGAAVTGAAGASLAGGELAVAGEAADDAPAAGSSTAGHVVTGAADVAGSSTVSHVVTGATDVAAASSTAGHVVTGAANVAAAGATLADLSPAPAASAEARPAPQPLPAGRIAVATAAASGTVPDPQAVPPTERLGDPDTRLDGTAPGAHLAAAVSGFQAAHAGEALAVRFVVENHGREAIAGTVAGEADFHHADGTIQTVKASATYKARQRSPKQLAFAWPASGGEFTSVRLVVHDARTGRLLKAAYPVGVR